MRIKMNNFEELENIWGNQKDSTPQKQADKALSDVKENTLRIQRGFLSTIGILSLTVLILLVYAITYKAYEHVSFFAGISTMIVLLLVRISLEYSSYKHLKTLVYSQTIHSYASQNEKFYKKRKMVNYILTPLIFIGYWVAFASLLPLFKANLSHGFYAYILVSGVVIFFILAFIIYKSIQKEVKILKNMQRIILAVKNP